MSFLMVFFNMVDGCRSKLVNVVSGVPVCSFIRSVIEEVVCMMY